MLNTDEDSFICDFAEYYTIYNYKQYPATYIGTLAKGLPDRSRIKLKLANEPVSCEMGMLASCTDALNFLVWSKTEDAKHGWNKPKSIIKALYGDEKEKEVIGYDSGEEFDKAFSKIAGE